MQIIPEIAQKVKKKQQQQQLECTGGWRSVMLKQETV